jgi:hypothetical protein
MGPVDALDQRSPGPHRVVVGEDGALRDLPVRARPRQDDGRAIAEASVDAVGADELRPAPGGPHVARGAVADGLPEAAMLGQLVSSPEESRVGTMDRGGADATRFAAQEVAAVLLPAGEPIADRVRQRDRQAGASVVSRSDAARSAGLAAGAEADGRDPRDAAAAAERRRERGEVPVRRRVASERRGHAPLTPDHRGIRPARDRHRREVHLEVGDAGDAGHPHRSGAPQHGSVAELALLVVAPAPDRAVGLARAGEVVADGDLGDAVETLDHHGVQR